jgi:hypothetical protein
MGSRLGDMDAEQYCIATDAMNKELQIIPQEVWGKFCKQEKVLLFRDAEYVVERNPTKGRTKRLLNGDFPGRNSRPNWSN